LASGDAAARRDPPMGGLSITHLLVVLIIALLLFGAGRVSEIGKGLGEGIRNFKKGIREEDDEPKPKKKADADEDDVEVQVVRVPKQLAAADAPKKKKVIQIEVDDDADEEEIARRIAAKKKAARAAEDEAS
jgi:sec-independent protein translocase protein TatA